MLVTFLLCRAEKLIKATRVSRDTPGASLPSKTARANNFGAKKERRYGMSIFRFT
jgi:hypothetical protein